MQFAEDYLCVAKAGHTAPNDPIVVIEDCHKCSFMSQLL